MEWADVAWILVLLAGLALVAVWAVALLQISAASGLGPLERVLWIVGVFLVPFLGAVAWFIFGRDRNRRLAFEYRISAQVGRRS